MSQVPSDPLHGITFTPEELRASITEFQGVVFDAQDVGTVEGAISFLALAHSVLPIVDTQTDRIELEAEIADSAERTVAFLKDHKEQFGSTIGGLGKLAAQQQRPLERARQEAELTAQRERKFLEAQELRNQIIQIEQKHSVTARDLRSTEFHVGKETRNGTWLMKEIEGIRQSGSDAAIFREEEARFLSGLALCKNSHRDIQELHASIERITVLQNKLLRAGSNKIENGLFTAVSKMRELYEADSARLENDSKLKPFAQFASAFEKNEEDLLEHFLGQIDEGPFTAAEEEPLVPFEACYIDAIAKDSSPLRELDESEVNEKDILEDIERAVKNSGGNYIVEPERISDFIELRRKLIERYGESAIRTMRTLRPKWHPLPWYGLEVTQGVGHEPMIVLECAIYGNASYHINNGDWRGTVQFTRRDAKTLGAKAHIHPDSSNHDHVSLLLDVVKKGYKV